MIVGRCFSGDDDTKLAWLQHDQYQGVIRHWISEARRTYLFAESVVGSSSEFGRSVAALTTFDHRAIQFAHDIMAAQFRRGEQSRQPDLFAERAGTDSEEAVSRWWDFVHAEVSRLMGEPTIVRLTLEAVLRRRDPPGGGANGALMDALRARYDLWGEGA